MFACVHSSVKGLWCRANGDGCCGARDNDDDDRDRGRDHGNADHLPF